ncbi:ABC transporter permease [Propionibacteriaceae bacterium Y2011]
MAPDRRFAVWRTIVLARIRSQLAYRSSFWLNASNSFLLGGLEFIEIYVLLSVSPVFGGLTLAQATFVFALSTVGFAGADLVFGQMDSLPTFIRSGQLESFLTKPLPLLPQLLSSSFQLRRAARMVFGVLALVVSVTQLDVVWTPVTVALTVVTPVFGMMIFASLFVLAGGCQFWLVNGAEFTNAFVYGGSYASRLPGGVLLAPIRVFFTFVVPTTITAYLPALLILGLDGPPGLPSWLAWFAPLFAAWSWLLALLVWRAGVRKYTGAGG